MHVRALLLFLLSFCSALLAVDHVQITWADLSPHGAAKPHPFNALSIEQRDDVNLIVLVRAAVKRAEAQNRPLSASAKKLVEEANSAEAELLADGHNLETLLAESREYDRLVSEQGNDLVEELDSQSVRMHGYVVPLAYTEERAVTQFLMVPVAGACIHLPPPPVNQILNISFPQGVKVEQYEAVTVLGRISVGLGREDAFLIDGTRSIDFGYSIKAESVEMFKGN